MNTHGTLLPKERNCDIHRKISILNSPAEPLYISNDQMKIGLINASIR